MFHQSTSRNQRSKGSQVKKTVQWALFLAVIIWLLYQVKNSHDRKAESVVGSQNDTSEGYQYLHLGRKGQAGYNSGTTADTDKVKSDQASEREGSEGGAADSLDRQIDEEVQDEALNKEHDKGTVDDFNTQEKGEDESMNREHEEFEKDVVNKEEKENDMEHWSKEERNGDYLNGGVEANNSSNAEMVDSKVSTEEASNEKHEESYEDSTNHLHKEIEGEQQSNETSNADFQYNGRIKANGKSSSEVEDTKESTEETSNKEHEEVQEDITNNGENVNVEERRNAAENIVNSQITDGVETTNKITTEVEISKEDISKQTNGMNDNSFLDDNEIEKGIHEFPDENRVLKDGEFVAHSSLNKPNSDDQQATKSDQELISGSLTQNPLTVNAILNENTKPGAEYSDVGIPGIENSVSLSLSNEHINIVMPSNNETSGREAVESQESNVSEVESTSNNTPEETKFDIQSGDELANTSPMKEQHSVEMQTDKVTPNLEVTDSQWDDGSQGKTTDINNEKIGPSSEGEVANISLPTEQTNTEVLTTNDSPGKEEPHGDGASEAEKTSDNLPEDSKSDPSSDKGTGSEGGNTRVPLSDVMNAETEREDGVSLESSNSVLVPQKENMEPTEAKAQQQDGSEEQRKEEF